MKEKTFLQKEGLSANLNAMRWSGEQSERSPPDRQNMCMPVCSAMSDSLQPHRL